MPIVLITKKDSDSGFGLTILEYSGIVYYSELLIPTSETAVRACVAKLASQKEEQIQQLLRDKQIFLIADEAEIAKQKYISVFVGSLDAPNQTFLIDCHPLERGSNVDSSNILHTVDDIL